MASSRNNDLFPALGGGVATNISTATPQPPGTAAAGTSGDVSDAGHIHRHSYPAEMNVWNVPATWNASTNSPALASGIANATNTLYLVTTAGSTTLDGISSWVVGDSVYFDSVSATWKKINASPFEDVVFTGLGTGSYDGEIKRVTDVGNVKFYMRWSGTDSVWYPLVGEQLYYVGAVVTDSNSTGTQTLTLPTVAHPANFWRSGTGCMAELVAETSIAATARTCVITLGSEDFVALPTAANRRIGGRWGFVADGAATQWSYMKKDANETNAEISSNTNVTNLAQTLSGALNIAGSVTFTTAASAAVAKLRRYKLYLIRG